MKSSTTSHGTPSTSSRSPPSLVSPGRRGCSRVRGRGARGLDSRRRRPSQLGRESRRRGGRPIGTPPSARAQRSACVASLVRRTLQATRRRYPGPRRTPLVPARRRVRRLTGASRTPQAVQALGWRRADPTTEPRRHRGRLWRGRGPSQEPEGPRPEGPRPRQAQGRPGRRAAPSAAPARARPPVAKKRRAPRESLPHRPPERYACRLLVGASDSPWRWGPLNPLSPRGDAIVLLRFRRPPSTDPADGPGQCPPRSP
jgi:hypothetical protein